MDKQILDILLDKDEWQSFDCKRVLIKPAKLLETVVSFSNTNGGTIVLGLEDPRKAKREQRLVGINENLDNVSEFLKLIEKDFSPPIYSWEKEYMPILNKNKQEDQLLIFFIKKSNEVHSLKNGDTYVRRGSQNIKIGATEIMNLQYEKGLRKYEDEISNVSDLKDIDKNLLREYKKDTKSENEDDWQFLKDNALVKIVNNKRYLTKAGILLFGKNPTVLLKSKCGIKVSHYFGTKPSYSGNPNFVEKPFTIEGSLIKQIHEMIDYFRTVVRKLPPKLSGAVFKTSLSIPEWAFQEAVTNAVIHRNYYIENDIQVRFFDDRVEIETPGTYPGYITVNNIRDERFARNPVIQRVLNRFDKSPNLDIGEGVDRMFKIMKDNNLYEPLYFPPRLRPNSVLVVLFNLMKIRYWDTISKFLEENFVINNQIGREITGITDSVEMSRLFRQWVDKGLIEAVGKSKKGRSYKKPGTVISKDLFSGRVIINKKYDKNPKK